MLPKNYGVRVDQVRRRLLLQEGHLLVQELRQPAVIAVEKAQELAAGGANGGVASSGRAPMTLFEVDNAVTIGSEDRPQLFRIG